MVQAPNPQAGHSGPPQGGGPERQVSTRDPKQPKENAKEKAKTERKEEEGGVPGRLPRRDQPHAGATWTGGSVQPGGQPLRAAVRRNVGGDAQPNLRCRGVNRTHRRRRNLQSPSRS